MKREALKNLERISGETERGSIRKRLPYGKNGVDRFATRWASRRTRTLAVLRAFTLLFFPSLGGRGQRGGGTFSTARQSASPRPTRAIGGPAQGHGLHPPLFLPKLMAIFQRVQNNIGFTLIEAVLTITILGIGLFGIMTLFQRAVAKQADTEKLFIAENLASAKLEQMIADKTFQGYTFITAANYPSPENLSGIGFPGFTRTTSITEVDAGDLLTVHSNSGYKRLSVTVAITGGSSVNLVTLVTQWRP